MLCRTWAQPSLCASLNFKCMCTVDICIDPQYILCMCSYNLVVALSLCQEHRSLRGYGLPSAQEVTQYWLALHFLWADSPLFSATPLRMFTSSSSSPVSLSHPPLHPLPWSRDFTPVDSGQVWPKHHQWRRLLSWPCWNPDYFLLCTLIKT